MQSTSAPCPATATDMQQNMRTATHPICCKTRKIWDPRLQVADHTLSAKRSCQQQQSPNFNMLIAAAAHTPTAYDDSERTHSDMQRTSATMRSHCSGSAARYAHNNTLQQTRAMGSSSTGSRSCLRATGSCRSATGELNDIVEPPNKASSSGRNESCTNRNGELKY